MKKLLSILAAVGLTATSASAVVACTATVSQDAVTVLGDGSVSMVAQDMKLKADLDPTSAGTDITGNYKAFDSDGNVANGVNDLKIVLSNHTDKKIKKGKEVKVNITFKLDKTIYNANKKYSVRIGFANGAKKLDGKEAVKINLKTPASWDAASVDADGNINFSTAVTGPTALLSKANEFEVVDGADKIDGATVAYTAPVSTAVKLAAGDENTTGTLTIKFKAPAMKTTNQQLSYTVVVANEADQAKIKIAHASITFSVPKLSPTISDVIHLSGDVMGTEPPGPDGDQSGVTGNNSWYITRPAMIKGLSDDAALKMYNLFFPSNKTKDASVARTKLNAMAAMKDTDATTAKPNVEYGAYKGATIKSDGTLDGGTGLLWNKIVPDGTVYVIQFFEWGDNKTVNSSPVYNVYLTFDKNDYKAK